VVTWLEITFDDVARLQGEDADGELAMILWAEPTGALFDLQVEATGVPAGHGFCAGGAPGWRLCGEADETLAFSRVDNGEPMTVTGYTFDETGTPVEFVEVDLTGTAPTRSVTLEFDGVTEVDPVTISVTLLLPADAQSYLNRFGVLTEHGLPFFPQHPETQLIRGGAHDVEPSVDGGAIDMRVTYFPIADAEVHWQYAAYALVASAASSSPWSNRSFIDQVEDGGIYEIMDIPRIPEAGVVEDLGSRIETQEIEGAELYQVWLHDMDYQLWYWTIMSPNGPVFRVPRLPSGLPPQDDWPAPRALMSADFWVYDALFPEEDPDREGIVELRRSRSPVFRLAFDWCEPDCDGRSCGDDGCGWSCEPGCGSGERCEEPSGECVVCEPQCDGRACGDDGCGGTCAPGCDGTDTCSEAAGSCVAPAGDFVDIPAGTFLMGSPEGELGRDPTRETQHEVTLSRGFMILSTEVTQSDFEALMGYNPSDDASCGASCPVEDLDWHEAAAYCNAMSAAESLAECYECTGTGSDSVCDLAAAYATVYDCPGYRLPTEAEWEYAARGGTTTATYAGDLPEDTTTCGDNPVLDPIAWWCNTAFGVPHAVGGRDPNGWGLYDVLGNVSEMCHDRLDRFVDHDPGAVTDPTGSDASTRAARGGSFNEHANAQSFRVPARGVMAPSIGDPHVGFRVARTAP